jgi:hypothetical protein
VALAFVNQMAHAQIGESFESVLANATLQFRVNLSAVLDNSIIIKSDLTHLELKLSSSSSPCEKDHQYISVAEQTLSNKFVQFLELIDCNGGKLTYALSQPIADSVAPVRLSIRDWLNGNWRLSEISNWQLSIAQLHFKIEKSSGHEGGNSRTRFDVFYEQISDPMIPTETIQFVFEETRTAKELNKRYLVDLGIIAPKLSLSERVQNEPLSYFKQVQYFDSSNEISGKTYAAQSAGYLNKITYLAFKQAIGKKFLATPAQ